MYWKGCQTEAPAYRTSVLGRPRCHRRNLWSPSLSLLDIPAADIPAAQDTWFAAIAAVPGLLRPLRQALDRSRDRPVVAPAGRAGGSAAQTPNLYMFFVYTGWTTYTEPNSVTIIGRPL